MSSPLSAGLRTALEKILKAAGEVEKLQGTEEDLKQRVEQIMKTYIWDPLQVRYEPRYEYRIGTTIGYGRVDALYGTVIFEYKKPGTLERILERENAIRKMKDVYIPGVLGIKEIADLIIEAERRGLSPRIVGIILDGYSVIFVEYSPETEEYKVDHLDLRGERGLEVLRRIVRTVLASHKKVLDPRLLAADFGYQSSICRSSVKIFYEKLEKPRSRKTEAMFEEWKKEVSQAYPISGDVLAKVAEIFGLPGHGVDGAKLFYAIQTYYALIIKLLAVEVAARFHDAAVSTYLEMLRKKAEAGGSEELLKEMKYLEMGMAYSHYGIKNFLEGDLLSWYLEEWDQSVYEVVRNIVKTLGEYDVEAITLDLSRTRDMFKMLYEELIPRKEVRRLLGFYTTPDWLAELLLDELGLSAEKFLNMLRGGGDPLEIRVLDPACGTGTFIVLVVQRLAEALREHGNLTGGRLAQALKKITRNIVGFDIDPMAVLTARANYLIALAASGLLEYKGGDMVEIPVYWANPIITAEERRDTYMVYLPDGRIKSIEVVKIEMPQISKKFHIPSRLVKRGAAMEILSLLREDLDLGQPEDQVKRKLENMGYWDDASELKDFELESLRELYKHLLDLKRKGLDSIWIPAIKSHITPTTFRNSFDYIVGNPPWIALRYIESVGYQGKVKELVEYYTLLLEAHLITHMEMATLFLLRTAHLYLKEGGLIGFVMPRSIFSADQHARFREGSFGNVKLGIEKIIDCEKVSPLFYVPTCAIVARKGGRTSYPVKALVIEGELPENEHKIISLERARGHLSFQERELYLNKIGERSFLDYERIEIREGRSDYYDWFYQGATIVPASYWLIDIVDASHPDFVFVKTDEERVVQRGKVRMIVGPLPVERSFIYGVLTSAEVLPFCHLNPNTAVLPIKPLKYMYKLLRRREALEEGYPHLARWLENVEELWEKYRGEKVEKLDVYGYLDYRRKLSSQDPGKRYKVVYLTSGTYLCSAVVMDEPREKDGVVMNKTIIDSTLYWFGTDDIEEAYYLAAVLNSRVLDEMIKKMQSKGAYGERHIHKKPLELPIPRYDSSDPVCKRLSELGREASELAKKKLPEILRELGYDRELGERGVLTPQEVGRLRQRLREELENILGEIDSLVLELLKKSSRGSIGLQGYIKSS